MFTVLCNKDADTSNIKTKIKSCRAIYKELLVTICIYLFLKKNLTIKIDNVGTSLFYFYSRNGEWATKSIKNCFVGRAKSKFFFCNYHRLSASLRQPKMSVIGNRMKPLTDEISKRIFTSSTILNRQMGKQLHFLWIFCITNTLQNMKTDMNTSKTLIKTSEAKMYSMILKKCNRWMKLLYMAKTFKFIICLSTVPKMQYNGQYNHKWQNDT